MTPSRTLPSKLPEITLAFWIMKICATTLGETAGDLLSVSSLALTGAANISLSTRTVEKAKDWPEVRTVDNGSQPIIGTIDAMPSPIPIVPARPRIARPMPRSVQP